MMGEEEKTPLMPISLSLLESLWNRGAQFLGSRYGLICGAMSWISESSLVAAMSNAGGFGVIACGSLAPEGLRTEILKTRALTTATFGVNVITFHPQIDDLLHVCIDEKVTHVFLAGGLPSRKALAMLREHGIRPVCFAPALAIGKRLIQMGAEALIIEGNEAGGHVGPVSTGVLMQEILPDLAEQVPVFVAGGIGNGAGIAFCLGAGAAGCQLGTRFACAKESIAHQRFKEAFFKANARNTVLSPQLDTRFPIIAVRVIENAAVQHFIDTQRKAIMAYEAGTVSQKEAQLEIEHFWAGALRRAAIDGDIENGSIMAGQSVGMVTREETCEEIIQSLISDTLRNLGHCIPRFCAA